MHHDTLPRGGRDGRQAAIAGLAASAAVHAALFAFVTFQAAPPAERARVPRDAFADAAVIHLIPSPSDAPVPTSTASDPGASPADAPVSSSRSAAAVAGFAAPAPPVLLMYGEPAASPLLLVGVVDTAEDGSRTAAAVRPAGYTPGGVRKAKLGWSGRESDRPAADGHGTGGRRAGVCDGHCPVRPPRPGGPGH